MTPDAAHREHRAPRAADHTGPVRPQRPALLAGEEAETPDRHIVRGID